MTALLDVEAAQAKDLVDTLVLRAGLLTGAPHPAAGATSADGGCRDRLMTAAPQLTADPVAELQALLEAANPAPSEGTQRVTLVALRRWLRLGHTIDELEDESVVAHHLDVESALSPSSRVSKRRDLERAAEWLRGDFAPKRPVPVPYRRAPWVAVADEASKRLQAAFDEGPRKLLPSTRKQTDRAMRRWLRQGRALADLGNAEAIADHCASLKLTEGSARQYRGCLRRAHRYLTGDYPPAKQTAEQRRRSKKPRPAPAPTPVAVEDTAAAPLPPRRRRPRPELQGRSSDGQSARLRSERPPVRVRPSLTPARKPVAGERWVRQDAPTAHVIEARDTDTHHTARAKCGEWVSGRSGRLALADDPRCPRCGA